MKLKGNSYTTFLGWNGYVILEEGKLRIQSTDSRLSAVSLCTEDALKLATLIIQAYGEA